MSNISVSIIVPCYNVEPYLERCLDSLIQQTLKNIEIICIDDKSTDNTLKVLRKYVKKDKRIKLIEQKENQGVTIARNEGLKIVRGDYIGFVDPDDYVDLDFYEKLYDVAESSNADIVKGNVISVSSDGKKSLTDNNMDNIEKHISNFSNKFWSAIYKTEFIEKNQITFPEYIISLQDAVFLTKICLKVKNIKLVYNTYYHYFYQRPGSLDSQFLSHKKAESKYNAILLNINLIDKANLNKNELKLFMWPHVLSHLLYEIHKDFELESDRKKYFDLLVCLVKKNNYSNELKARIAKRKIKYILQNNYKNFVFEKRKRLYLFGFLPVVLITLIENEKQIKLFDFIPLIKIIDNKYFLFNFLMVLKVRG